MSWRPLCTQPPRDPPHHVSPFLPMYPHPRPPFHLPALGALPCAFPCPSPALGAANLRHPPKPCYRHLSRHIVLLCPPYGVSADRVHGFGRFNLQNTSRRRGLRRRGSSDHLGRLEEERRRHSKT